MAMVRLAVQGAGLIGRRHVAHVVASDRAVLAGIIDPAPATQALAADLGTAWYPSLAAMMVQDRPQGVIVATPNQMHVANGLDCIAAGIAVLMEKPIADTLDGATRLVEAAEATGVPLLVGHHRRHNRLIQAARRSIQDGALGRMVAAQAMCWFHKPADYFEAAWRREPGAGPVFLNLIHDIDLLRYLCGDVVAVQAMESNAQRGNAVEDTATILLRFANGTLGSVTVSDIISAPWSWELTTGENPAYPHTAESCYMIGGTQGSLTVPQLEVWHHPAGAGWWNPIERTRLDNASPDPLALQVANFCDVLQGMAAPVVSGRDGLETLRVIIAIKQAAATGHLIELSQIV